MCGRFFVDAKNREIDRLLEQLGPRAGDIRLGEVFPSNPALALAKGARGAAPRVMIWGFPRWDNKGLIINARAESALEKPLFRSALLKDRMVAPASGFFEWASALAGGKDKYFFSAADSGPLYLAGFGKGFPDSPDPRFVLLTVPANDSVKFCHARMPLLIPEGDVAAWLDGENLPSFLSRVPQPVAAAKWG